jgi:hypothetical protein
MASFESRLCTTIGSSSSTGDRQLLAEDLLLNVARRVIVVEVEAALPHGDRLRVRQQRPQPFRMVRRPTRRVVRVYAERAPDPFFRLAEREQVVRLVEPDRRDQEPPDSALPGALDDRPPLVEREVLEMAVGVDEQAT